METFSALLAICAGNSLVTGEFPAQRPVRRSFDVFVDLRLNKRMSRQRWGWWFETPLRPLWRHCDALCLFHLLTGLLLGPFMCPSICYSYNIKLVDIVNAASYITKPKQRMPSLHPAVQIMISTICSCICITRIMDILVQYSHSECPWLNCAFPRRMVIYDWISINIDIREPTIWL